MIYASQHAQGATLTQQPYSGENPAVERPQPQVDAEFAEIAERVNPFVVESVGYLAVGEAVGPEGRKENITVAVGAARMPDSYYAPGHVPEKQLREVVESHMAQVHPGVAWHMQEQQSRAHNLLPDDESDEGDSEEDGNQTSARKSKKRSDFGLAPKFK